MSEICNLDEIDRILVQARKNNVQESITGVLYYSHQFFFQYLEGPSQNIETIFSKIVQDKRHTHVKLVEKKPIGERLFTDWAMAYILQSEQLTSTHQRLFNTDHFDPRHITPDKAILLVNELRTLLPQVHYANLARY